MPKLLIIKKYVFLLFSSDIFEKRKHIHVEIRKGKRRRSAKFWLEPEIELVKRGNLTNAEINAAKKLIKQHFKLLNNQIDKFSKKEKIKIIKK